MVIMSRQALFDAAWERPLTDIAAEVGITSTGLKKICDKHDIPTPGRGYWAHRRAGGHIGKPKLRPVKDPRLEEVGIIGATPLPAPVTKAIEKARAVRQAEKPTRPLQADAPEIPTTDRKELAATRKALLRAKPDKDGFVSITGAGVIPTKVAPESIVAALDFLSHLIAEGDARGWRLKSVEGPLAFVIDGETVKFRLEEAPTKRPHKPTPEELATKARRDRWGGSSQPWRTWDLSPSGKLALVFEENDYSGLRRTYSQRSGVAFTNSLPSIVEGFVGHSTLKAERRREDEARAKAAAIAQARRERLAAFDQREERRASFIAAISAGLAERAQLAAALTHLQESQPESLAKLADMTGWIERRLKALDARLDPEALEVSARHGDVDFKEPPGKAERRWYAPPANLHLWIPADEEGHVRSVSELEWAIAEGRIMDPGDEPPKQTSLPIQPIKRKILSDMTSPSKLLSLAVRHVFVSDEHHNNK